MATFSFKISYSKYNLKYVFLYNIIIIIFYFIDNKVQASWNTLIDIYHHELKKLETSNGNELKKSNWVHFNSMLFLQEMINSKMCFRRERQLKLEEECQNNPEEVLTTENDISDNDDISSLINLINLDVNPIMMPKNSRPYKTNNRKMKNYSDLYTNSMRRIENKKIDVAEKNSQPEEDDDLLFLKSLLPQIKLLSLTKKLEIRLKFQDILYKEMVDFEKCNGMY